MNFFLPVIFYRSFYQNIWNKNIQIAFNIVDLTIKVIQSRRVMWFTLHIFYLQLNARVASPNAKTVFSCRLNKLHSFLRKCRDLYDYVTFEQKYKSSRNLKFR